MNESRLLGVSNWDKQLKVVSGACSVLCSASKGEFFIRRLVMRIHLISKFLVVACVLAGCVAEGEPGYSPGTAGQSAFLMVDVPKFNAVRFLNWKLDVYHGWQSEDVFVEDIYQPNMVRIVRRQGFRYDVRIVHYTKNSLPAESILLAESKSEFDAFLETTDMVSLKIHKVDDKTKGIHGHFAKLSGECVAARFTKHLKPLKASDRPGLVQPDTLVTMLVCGMNVDPLTFIRQFDFAKSSDREFLRVNKSNGRNYVPVPYSGPLKGNAIPLESRSNLNICNLARSSFVRWNDKYQPREVAEARRRGFDIQECNILIHEEGHK